LLPTPVLPSHVIVAPSLNLQPYLAR